MNAETAHVISPSAEEAWRLVGHYLHRLSHDVPGQWRLRDHEASQCRERVGSLPTENGNGAQVALWLRLSDTEVPCDDPGCAAREMYLTSDGSDSVPTSGPLPAFARRDGFGYFEWLRDLRTRPDCSGDRRPPSTDPGQTHPRREGHRSAPPRTRSAGSPGDRRAGGRVSHVPL
ncbi:hypothetical protein [Streptomyces sp. NPDC059783]|uniref:hypothetical protein n=1 Tax=Streptomyces sp. NPDC059783 TaxID=3346944 RepID=UPI00364B3953